jgi:hypothetical protein
LFGYAPVLRWVYTHLCSEIVLVFFGNGPGFIGRTRTTPEQSQQQNRRNTGAIWERYKTRTEQLPLPTVRRGSANASA